MLSRKERASGDVRNASNLQKAPSKEKGLPLKSRRWLL
jgi:hypothetical protein